MAFVEWFPAVPSWLQLSASVVGSLAGTIVAVARAWRTRPVQWIAAKIREDARDREAERVAQIVDRLFVRQLAPSLARIMAELRVDDGGSAISTLRRDVDDLTETVAEVAERVDRLETQ